MPLCTFSKGKLYTTRKMELPEKKTINDFTNSLDAINPSVIKTHCIRWEGHHLANASPVHCPILPI